MPMRFQGLTYISVLATVAALTLAPTEASAQITGWGEVALDATLTGSALTPAVGTSLVGQCTGRLVPSSGHLDLTCSSDIPNAARVFVTLDAAGGSATELFTVGNGNVVGGDFVLTDEEVAAFLTGRAHVVAASPGRPNGQVGARLVPRTPLGEQIMRFNLRNDSLVSNNSDALGHCALNVSADQDTITVVCSHDVANAQQLRLIVDGGVVATFNDVDSPFETTLPTLASDYSRFLAGNYGLILTSAGFPQGELGVVLDRCLEGPNTLCLLGDRFRVTISFVAPGSPAKLAGAVTQRSSDSGLFWFFNPDNWESLLKVLNACPINASFWVFQSANTNVAFTATVYDTLTGRVRNYSNAQGNLAAPVADTIAFPCS